MALIPSLRQALQVAVAAAVVTLGSMGSVAASSSGKKVLLLQSLSAHPYVAAITKSFRERAESYGMELTIQAAGLDAALQGRQMDDGIARKFDLIVVSPVSEQGIVPSLARAKQAGIPVLVVNNPVRSGSEELYVSFVGQDQKAMGRLAGQAIVQALRDSGRDGGRVALITGALSQGIGPRRLEGIQEALAGTKVQIVATEDGRWDTATSERIAGQLYARFAATGGLDVVYGMADNQAVAAVKAAEAAGLPVGTGAKQLVVVGGNCLKEGIDAIRAGKLQATVTQVPVEVGHAAAAAANDLFNGKTLPKDILLPVELITKANVDRWAEPCTY